LQTLKDNAPAVVDMLEKTEGKASPLAVKADEKYTLDHTIVVYLMGPGNKFLTYLGSNLDEHAMTEIILDEISADLKRQILPPSHK